MKPRWRADKSNVQILILNYWFGFVRAWGEAPVCRGGPAYSNVRKIPQWKSLAASRDLWPCSFRQCLYTCHKRKPTQPELKTNFQHQRTLAKALTTLANPPSKPCVPASSKLRRRFGPSSQQLAATARRKTRWSSGDQESNPGA